MKLTIVVALLAAGCFTKPDRPNALVGDAHALHDGRPHDGTPQRLTPRLINNAYWATGVDMTGMSQTTFSIPTAGINDGDLVLFIASVDNGSNTVWPSPISAGFVQLAQIFYGNDGETYVVSEKIANHEPSMYQGNYGGGIDSGAAAITLIAIAGADPANPIDAFTTASSTGNETATVDCTSPGVTTHVNGDTIIYASGADWESPISSNTVVTPAGYTLLTSLGDYGPADTSGVAHWDWTSLQEWRSQRMLRKATAVRSSAASRPTVNDHGLGWNAVIAVAPAP